MARLVRHERNRPFLIQAGGQNIAICGCGLSKNLPYCDGTHKITRDEEPDKLFVYDEELHRTSVQLQDENGNLVSPPPCYLPD